MGCIDNSSGCGCHISGGSCLSITGDGSVGNPYVVSVILDPNAGNILSCSGSGLLALSAMPVGAMIDYPSTTPPAGWLLANGQSVSRTTYAALNALAALASYAVPWGPGDGVNTFNVPSV